MAIIQDVKSATMVSGYVEKTFDEAKLELENKCYQVISLEQFAKLRREQGVAHLVSTIGAYVKEGFLYVPQKEHS